MNDDLYFNKTMWCFPSIPSANECILFIFISVTLKCNVVENKHVLKSFGNKILYFEIHI